MKFRPWMSAAAVATMALGLFCFGPSPVAAEEQVSPNQVSDDWGTNRYKVYQYPGKHNSFFMYPKSYVTFDVVNGKYWMMDHPRAELRLKKANNPEHVFAPIVGPHRTVNYESITVTIYTPDMKVLGVFDNINNRYLYSIPRDGNDYERLIFKVESDCDHNIDIKFRVWDPVDPVIAEPMPNEKYRY